MTKQVRSPQAQEKVLQGTGIRCFVAHHQPKIFNFPFQVVILQPKMAQNLITCAFSKFDHSRSHLRVLQALLFLATMRPIIGETMLMQSGQSHCKKIVPVLKSSNFLTTKGKTILTRRDFDLKSSEIHQEIGKRTNSGHTRIECLGGADRRPGGTAADP